jgi:hypothetical protein
MPAKTVTASPSAKTEAKALAKPKSVGTAKAGARAAPMAKPKPAARSKPVVGPAKPKAKLVRDSFTMPKVDFDLVDVLKERALGFKRPAKKSELLRAGLHALSALNDAALRAALEALAPLKPGRPKKAG